MCTRYYNVNCVLPYTPSATKGTSSGYYRKVAMKFSMGHPRKMDFLAWLGPTKSVSTQSPIQRDVRGMTYFILKVILYLKKNERKSVLVCFLNGGICAHGISKSAPIHLCHSRHSPASGQMESSKASLRAVCLWEALTVPFPHLHWV